jgi:hypothetical protein
MFFTSTFSGNNFTDESMHTTSLKSERVKAKIERLREREIKVHYMLWEANKKTELALEIKNMQKKPASLAKLKVMPLFEIMKLRQRVLLQKNQNTAAFRLQRWWRRTMERRNGPHVFTLNEIKMMMGGILRIQRWFRNRKKRIER